MPSAVAWGSLAYQVAVVSTTFIAWFALIVHVPTAAKLTVEPETAQTPGVALVNVTGLLVPTLLVAVMLYGVALWPTSGAPLSRPVVVSNDMPSGTAGLIA